jgi:DNA-binding CsgD family transcriptional regulator
MVEPGEPLTERELEVVRLLATGISNKEIAARLHISTNTVRVHLRNIFAKLEAQSRTEVTMIAVRNGWISISAPEGAEAALVEAEDTDAANQPAAVMVQVAPDPQAPPALALWRRVAAIITLGLLIALAVLAWPRSVNAPDAALADFERAGALPNEPVAALPSETSRWHVRSSIRTARTRPAVATVQGLVYVIGGEVNRAPTAEVLIYDPQQDAWRDGPPKPTAVMLAGAAVISDVIYVAGGLGTDGMPTNRLEALRVADGTWQVLPPLPQPLAGHSVAALGEQLYVIGGRTVEGLNSVVWVFDTRAQAWRAAEPLPTPRSQLAAAALDGRLYAIGGYDGQREYSTCEYFEPASNRWSACAPMIIPRGGLSLAQIGSSLYAVGGGLTGFVGFNERYDPTRDAWTPFEMPEPRMGDWRYTGIASMPDRFYVIGGSARGVPLADNYVYEVFTFRTFLPTFQAGGER